MKSTTTDHAALAEWSIGVCMSVQDFAAEVVEAFGNDHDLARQALEVARLTAEIRDSLWSRGSTEYDLFSRPHDSTARDALSLSVDDTGVMRPGFKGGE